MTAEFKQYRRKAKLSELRPFISGDRVVGVSIFISNEDRLAGSPKPGDMIARNPENHADQWLVAKAYFESNFEPEPVSAEGPKLILEKGGYDMTMRFASDGQVYNTARDENGDVLWTNEPPEAG